MTECTGGHDERSSADAGAEGAGGQRTGGRDADSTFDQGTASTASGIDEIAQRGTGSSANDAAGMDRAMGDDGADDALPGGADSAARDDAPAAGDDQGLNVPANTNAYRYQADMDQGTSNT